VPRLVTYGWLDRMPAAQQGPSQSARAATEERLPFLAMQHIQGCLLKQAVQARGLRSIEDLRTLAVSAARTLAAVHALGMVHGSVHKGNLLLGPPPENQVSFQPKHQHPCMRPTSLFSLTKFFSARRRCGSLTSSAQGSRSISPNITRTGYS
jgi:hypothetical protein